MVAVTKAPSEADINRLLNHHFEFRSIRADQMKVDDDYQRRINKNHVYQIASNFNPLAFGVLLVSERDDGSLYVIDGQHRWLALERLSSLDEMVPCHVYRNLTRQDEAIIFYMSANRKAITPVDKFRTKLFAGEPDSMEIAEILRRHGYQVSHHHGIKAVAAIERIYKYHGPNRVELIFDLLEHAFDDDEFIPQGTIILGLNQFISRYDGKYDRARLVRVLQLTGGDNLTHKATALRDLMRESVDSAAGRVMLSIYNNGMRTNRLPDWDSISRQALGFKARKSQSEDA